MRRAILLALLAFAGAAAATTNVDVRIESDRLTVVARQTPLRDILEGFARVGVHVRLDPSIDVVVSGSCRNTPMEEALNALLEPYAYILVWDVVRGPVGDLPRLAEIQVFAPGHKQALRPLLPDTGNLNVTRGALPDSPMFVADEILVGVRTQVSAEDFRRLLAQIGGTVVSSIPELGIYQVRLPANTNVPDLIEQLKRNPLIAAAEPNYVALLPREGRQADGSGGARPPLAAPAAGAAAVAVLDSGLLSGLGLDGHVIGSYDALHPGRAITDPGGHGTQMAMLAAGGVTPWGVEAQGEGVPVLAVRAFDDNGATSNFALMRAIRYAIEQGARVVNLSWGTETHSAFVASAVAYAQSRGAVVVAAAGNQPTGRPMYPAAYDGVVAVSATNPDQSLWEKSNYGNFVTIAAPGKATFSVGYGGPPGAYAGTSIASAYVARELALYFSRNPNAKAGQAVAALRQAVTDAGDKGRDPRYGYGVLDAAARAKLRGL